jgi:hypothetical protein
VPVAPSGMHCEVTVGPAGMHCEVSMLAHLGKKSSNICHRWISWAVLALKYHVKEGLRRDACEYLQQCSLFLFGLLPYFCLSACKYSCNSNCADGMNTEYSYWPVCAFCFWICLFRIAHAPLRRFNKTYASVPFVFFCLLLFLTLRRLLSLFFIFLM